jgi:uncharacterized alkaline shock family protein YloU
MKVFNAIVLVLNTLLFLVLGVLFISGAVSGSVGHSILEGFLAWYDDSLMTALAPRIAAAFCGLTLVAVAVSTAWGNIQDRRRERAVEFHTPLGKVYIALGALEDLARVVKNEIQGLKDIRLRVSAQRKGLKVRAKVVLWSDCNLPKVTEEIQEVVRTYIHEIVGPEAEVRPLVVVTKVAYRDPEEWDDETVRYPDRKSVV